MKPVPITVYGTAFIIMTTVESKIAGLTLPSCAVCESQRGYFLHETVFFQNTHDEEGS